MKVEVLAELTEEEAGMMLEALAEAETRARWQEARERGVVGEEMCDCSHAPHYGRCPAYAGHFAAPGVPLVCGCPHP